MVWMSLSPGAWSTSNIDPKRQIAAPSLPRTCIFSLRKYAPIKALGLISVANTDGNHMTYLMSTLSAPSGVTSTAGAKA